MDTEVAAFKQLHPGLRTVPTAQLPQRNTQGRIHRPLAILLHYPARAPPHVRNRDAQPRRPARNRLPPLGHASTTITEQAYAQLTDHRIRTEVEDALSTAVRLATAHMASCRGR
jgi:hypothetical protein